MKKQKFTDIYEKYGSLIIKLAMHRGMDKESAEEICQQVFMAYYQHMDRLSNDRIKPWLLCAAKNKIIDYRRKNATKEQKFQTEYYGRVDIVMQDNTELVLDRMIHTELSFQILSDLREKNQEWYEAIELICVENIPHEEAAKYLRISSQVLRARLYRARKYIRKKYEKELKFLN